MIRVLPGGCRVRVRLGIWFWVSLPTHPIADTTHELVEVYMDIADGTYTRVTPFRHGQTFSPAAFPDVYVRVEDILGPKR